MKKLTSIFLLLLLALLGSVMPLRFGLRKVARNIMEKRLERHGERMIFSEMDLKDAVWEHDNEFRLNGAMYDVAKVTIAANGERLYHCVQDKLETHLEERCDEAGLSPAHNADSRFQQRSTRLSFDWYKSENAFLGWRQLLDYETANQRTLWRQASVAISLGFTTTPSIPPECAA